MGGRHDGISGDVELDIISVGMEQETMLMEDVTEGKQIQDEEEGTKLRTLGDTLG